MAVPSLPLPSRSRAWLWLGLALGSPWAAFDCTGRVVPLGGAPPDSSSPLAPQPDASPPDASSDIASEEASDQDSSNDGDSDSSNDSDSSSDGDSDTGTKPEVPVFGTPVLVASLASSYGEQNPTLTTDLREICFSSARADSGTNVDVWCASRPGPDASFGAPEVVTAVSTDAFDSSPALSGDGLTLWVGLELEEGLGGLDIWESTRTTRDGSWAAPALRSDLSSPEDDIPRPLGNHSLTMPLGSRRGGGMYQTYLATRPATTQPFATPVLVEELMVAGYNTADAFLTEDGLTLYFVHAQNETGNIYLAKRATVDSKFDFIAPLASVNTSSDERDPWLSSDGTRLYFVSDRQDGVLHIYEARLTTP